MLAAIALSFGACVTLPRLQPPNISRSDHATPQGFARSVRFSGFDAIAFAGLIEKSNLQKKGRRGTLLALSGGGAGGAFGAGAVVGLTRSGSRPSFDMVTGVSTGALAAPFAFLGANWDAQLEEAFTRTVSDNLFTSYGIGSLFTTALYRDAPLRNLVDRFVTPQLIDAVAAESAGGRLLLIVTTNMDLGEPVVWNMGAIAARGGEPARVLFRNILIASASVPGVFSPVMIPVVQGGRLYEEMHADGGATMPFFASVRSSGIPGEQNDEADGPDVFVVVNGPLSMSEQATQRNTIAIARRGFSALLYQTFRNELLRVSTFVRTRGSTFRYTAVPNNYPYAGTLDFDTREMRLLFRYAATCAATGELWIGTGLTQATAERPPEACPGISPDEFAPSPR